MTLTAHLKTLLTLAVLSVLVLFGLTWGWSAATSPFPKRAPAKACVPTSLQPGDRVAAPKVTVSVYNSSSRVGLAERTMASFEDQGFGPGKVGNAPKGTNVLYAQIWTADRKNPAVQLVISRLGPRAHILEKPTLGPGVTVVVGTHFDKLVPGKSSVKVRTAATICSPPNP
ncbi:MAG: LytR C-terminal domain-containing protein [Nocardioides sp.]